MKILYIGNKLSSHGNTFTSIETLGALFSNEGFTVYYASSFKNKLIRMLDMIFSTFYYSKKVNYVLIDTYSTQNFWYALIVSQICRLLKVKYVSKLHGGDLPNRLKRSPVLSNLIFKNAYIISAPSNYLMNAFEKAGYKNLIHLPNTIEINNYSFLEEREMMEPRLLWVRSFSKIYNPKMAIDVVCKLKKTYPNVQLCMVGPDKENLLEECKKYAKDVNVEVAFTGKLSKVEWAELSKQYNIFINTTHFDNTPISVIEAMALGIPVVSTNVGGIPFLINDRKSGLLVNDGDVIAMVSSIKELINDELLTKKIVKNARNDVESFDWEVVKQQWFEILK